MSARRARWTAAGSALLVVALGALLLHLVATGDHLQYVKPGMRVPLLVTGGALVALGVVQGLRRRRHVHLPLAAACVLAPLLLLGVARPAPLGAGSELSSSPVFRVRPLQVVDIPATSYLPDGASDADVRANATAIGLDQFVAASFGSPEMIDGAAVRLFGQLGTRHDGQIAVQRYRIMCCAADAVLLSVVIDPDDVDGRLPADGTWVEVTGRWVTGSQKPPQLDLASLERAPRPENPYLS